MVFIAGGSDGVGRNCWDCGNVRAEILAFDGEDWKEVGQLQEARKDHAATKIDINKLKDFCN